jgi:hypothetical protein
VRARPGTAAASGSASEGFADVYERYFADIYRYIAGRLGRNVADDIAAPAQRAAIYRLLAQTPGLTVVSHVTNVRGQAGVGVRSGIWKGSVYTIIFDRRTFAPLGMNWTGVTGPMKGTHNGEVVLKTAIVDRTPPLP